MVKKFSALRQQLPLESQLRVKEKELFYFKHLADAFAGNLPPELVKTVTESVLTDISKGNK